MDDLLSGQIAAHRAALYHWFAWIFLTPPDMRAVEDLRNGRARQLLDTLAQDAAAKPGVQAMDRVLVADSVAAVTALLGAAHVRLFDGAGGTAVASPYRSAYAGDSGLLCQRASIEMDRVLRQHRLRLVERVCEPSDHLAVQLEVMAELALRYAEAERQGNQGLATLQTEQAEFLRHQILAWLPDFSRRLAEVDTLGFHAGLASVLQAVLEEDLALLTDCVPV